MKDLKLFTQSELSTLETLDIMGGTASAEASQTGCSNNVVGCNCTIILPVTIIQKHANLKM